MKPASPCLKCERRTVGCHAGCEEYGKFRKALDEWNDQVNIERNRGKEADDFLATNLASRRDLWEKGWK